MPPRPRPARDGALFIAPRPLPGRLIGHAGTFVSDVTAAYENLARRDDGQPVILITPAGLERLAERLIAEDGGYTRADYEEAGEWRPEEIARVRGHALITIAPEPDAGRLIEPTAADDVAAGYPAPTELRYVTVTVVECTDDDNRPTQSTRSCPGRPDVMWWFGTEGGRHRGRPRRRCRARRLASARQ